MGFRQDHSTASGRTRQDLNGSPVGYRHRLELFSDLLKLILNITEVQKILSVIYNRQKAFTCKSMQSKVDKYTSNQTFYKWSLSFSKVNYGYDYKPCQQDSYAINQYIYFKKLRATQQQYKDISPLIACRVFNHITFEIKFTELGTVFVSTCCKHDINLLLAAYKGNSPLKCRYLKVIISHYRKLYTVVTSWFSMFILRPYSHSSVWSTANQELSYTIKQYTLYCILMRSELRSLACCHFNHLDRPIITCDSKDCAARVKV